MFGHRLQRNLCFAVGKRAFGFHCAVAGSAVMGSTGWDVRRYCIASLAPTGRAGRNYWNALFRRTVENIVIFGLTLDSKATNVQLQQHP